VVDRSVRGEIRRRKRGAESDYVCLLNRVKGANRGEGITKSIIKKKQQEFFIRDTRFLFNFFFFFAFLPSTLSEGDKTFYCARTKNISKGMTGTRTS
jgi:hypothetical protein